MEFIPFEYHGCSFSKQDVIDHLPKCLRFVYGDYHTELEPDASWLNEMYPPNSTENDYEFICDIIITLESVITLYTNEINIDEKYIFELADNKTLCMIHHEIDLLDYKNKVRYRPTYSEIVEHIFGINCNMWLLNNDISTLFTRGI